MPSRNVWIKKLINKLFLVKIKGIAKGVESIGLNYLRKSKIILAFGLTLYPVSYD